MSRATGVTGGWRLCWAFALAESIAASSPVLATRPDIDLISSPFFESSDSYVTETHAQLLCQPRAAGRIEVASYLEFPTVRPQRESHVPVRIAHHQTNPKRI